MRSPNGGASDWTGVTPHFGVGDVVARRYRIEALVRQDLYGSVYKVRHVRYGQALILKVFHPFHFGSAADFAKVREAFDAVKSVQVPGVVRYLEIGEVDEIRYVTMDQVEGKSLEDLLREYLEAGQVLTLKEARRFIQEILGILQSIKGVSHGNLSPRNIIVPARMKPGLMGEASEIRLADFAQVTVNAASAGDLQLAPPEEVAYTAPELIQYGGGPSPRVDVYSVAAIFYEMLTGRKPVGERLEMPSRLRPDVPEELDLLLQACLNPEPAERLADLGELSSRLTTLVDDPTVHEPMETPRRNAVWVLLAGVVLAAGAGVWYATQDEALDPEAQIQHDTAQLLNEARSGAIEVSHEELERLAKAAPPGMAYIPPGKFVRGYLPDERLKARKTQEHLLSGLEAAGEVARLDGFYIDRYDAPNKKGAPPLTNISWPQADEACRKEGKRLCSADEWERACKGPKSLNYPYGMEYDPAPCPPSKKATYKQGEDYPGCESDFKVRDLAGGTWEWTSTASPEGDFGHIIKGGYPGSDNGGHRCAFRNQENNEATYNYLSYRCCMDLPPAGAAGAPDPAAPPPAPQGK